MENYKLYGLPSSSTRQAYRMMRLDFIALPLVILIEGFVSIAVEILTIRQLLPVAGGSVIVTSLIIGIFLLFLALGYQRGGMRSGQPHLILQKNFLLSACWLGIGLSYLFIILFFQVIEKTIGPHIIYSLTAYLLFIIAPLIYILGQTIPIIMNMVQQNRTVGMIGGSTLSLSTVGSFLGATCTTLIFMHYLGVAWTVVINFMLLIFLSMLLARSYRAFFITLLCAIPATWMVYLTNVSMEKRFFIVTNNYANYEVLNSTNSNLKKDERMLLINNAPSSFINAQGKAFPYIETIKYILFNNLHLQNANILILGAGGFTLSAVNAYHNHFTYVDIDAQIKPIAEQHFLPAKDSQFIVDDARHYLKSTQHTYQAIVVDVYSDVKSIPSHLLTREYMQDIQRRLAKNGVVIFNIIANPLLSDPYSKRIDNTIRTVFKSCMTFPHAYVDQPVNILYTCYNGSNRYDSSGYSDNLNTSTTDSFFW